MKSLFEFQQKMVSTGSTTAMMKLGKMYEQGAGTKQNLDKALEMYRRAKAGGHPGADAAIARVIRLRKALANAASRKKEQAAETKQKQREQQQRQAEAQHQAQLEREREARARAAREARAKARQQALARQRAKLERLRAAETKANAERAARARAAAAAAAQEKARQQALQRKQAVGTTTKPAVAGKKGKAKKAEKFQSDPCKSPAARLMSLCN